MKEYEKIAFDFLNSTGTTLEVKRAENQSCPLWAKHGEKHGLKYEITLSNKRGKYTFDFWDSIANSEVIGAIERAIRNFGYSQTAQDFKDEDLLKKHGIIRQRLFNKEEREKAIKSKEPSAYDVLACLDLLQEESFEDFCRAFGYDEDSKMAEKTFEACKEQDRNLRRLFTFKELEELEKII